MRPVRQPPPLIDLLNRPIATAQVVHEALEHVVIVKDLQSGFVIDLISDDRRVLREPRHNRAHNPFGVIAECRMGKVNVLTPPVRNG